MWCIGKLTDEYRHRMYDLLALYAKPFCRHEPVICIDEKSLQRIGHSRQPLPMAPHAPIREDYEYTRNGLNNAIRQINVDFLADVAFGARFEQVRKVRDARIRQKSRINYHRLHVRGQDQGPMPCDVRFLCSQAAPQFRFSSGITQC